jgi:hypothetical protein
LQSLGPAHDVELNALGFLKAAKAVGADRREVNEYIFVVAIAGNETKTFGVIKPLDNTLFHDGVPLEIGSLECFEEGIAASSALEQYVTAFNPLKDERNLMITGASVFWLWKD